MKLTAFILITLLLASCSQDEKSSEKSTSPKESEVDLSSDEAVYQELLKYRDPDFTELKPEDVCIIRPTEFTHLILTGSKYDGRCGSGEIFYKNKRYVDNSFARELMNDHGWNEESKRTKLILDWMKIISARWQIVLTEAPPFFDTATTIQFHQPYVEYHTSDKQYIAAGWIERPASPPALKSYYRIRMQFDESGEYTKSEYTDEINLYDGF